MKSKRSYQDAIVSELKTRWLGTSFGDMTGHTSANWVPCECFLRGLHVETSSKSKLFLNNNEIMQAISNLATAFVW